MDAHEERIAALERDVAQLRGGGGLLGWGAAAGLASWLAIVAGLITGPHLLAELNPQGKHSHRAGDCGQGELKPELPVREPVGFDAAPSPNGEDHSIRRDLEALGSKDDDFDRPDAEPPVPDPFPELPHAGKRTRK